MGLWVKEQMMLLYAELVVLQDKSSFATAVAAMYAEAVIDYFCSKNNLRLRAVVATSMKSKYFKLMLDLKQLNV